MPPACVLQRWLIVVDDDDDDDGAVKTPKPGGARNRYVCM